MSFGCTAACQQPINAQCHCTACHVTFRHLGDFESHRRGPTDDRYCAQPGALCLVEVDGVWATEESHEKTAAAVARIAAARSSSLTTDGSESVSGTPVGVA